MVLPLNLPVSISVIEQETWECTKPALKCQLLPRIAQSIQLCH
jgi:hypothetical protein